MSRIAIIGAGISGLTVAQLLKKRHEVVVFEKEAIPGGLIRCRRVNGNLFHICGGHVFNSKREDVLDWFWSKFERSEEFTRADRNSVVFMENGKKIPYPIENHMYLFDSDIQKAFIDNLIYMAENKGYEAQNFEEFLRGQFGETLYQLYFQPYNKKVWRRDLSQVPLSWLEGKLPMPTVAEMIYNNMNHVEEKSFVHATFWYEKMDGSQYIADRFSEGLDIRYNSNINVGSKAGGVWHVEGEDFDKIIFCGNIKQMPVFIQGIDMSPYIRQIESLEYHGTTSVFCEIDKNPYSWIYLPSRQHESHRIICTGNFAPSNNVDNKMTATIEFTDEMSKENILDNLTRIPLHPKYLDHEYHQYTYPIQDTHTREMIQSLKEYLAHYDFYFTDTKNHCIRKLTPDGVVSTFAGRGSASTSAYKWGKQNGEIRERARFNEPVALAYDEETKTFYVGDTGNFKIRKIAKEQEADEQGEGGSDDEQTGENQMDEIFPE